MEKATNGECKFLGRQKWSLHRTEGLRSFLLFLCIGLSSCHSPKNKEGYSDDILRIKVFPTKDNVRYLYASEVISDIEYIPLETTDQCLIGENLNVKISENYILVYSDPHCILFSRQGKYIRHIGSRGQGPEEYDNQVYYITIDEKSDMIYLSTWNTLLAYRISGEFVKKLNFKKLCDDVEITGSFREVVHWKDNLFCTNISRYTGKENYDFVVFSLDGQIIKLFPHSIKFEREDSNVFYGSTFDYDADIYLYNGQLKYRKPHSDTLFRLNDQLEFVPAVIFDLCGRTPPENIRYKGDDNYLSKYTDITHIQELENYIVFYCCFGDITPKGLPAGPHAGQICLYNKNNHELTIAKCNLLGKIKPPVPSNMPGVFISNNNNEQLIDDYSKPFINDIDGGYDFYIAGASIIQNTHQLLCKKCQAYELLRLNEKHFASKTIKNKEAHERLKNLLVNLNVDDNPVLMIATFK